MNSVAPPGPPTPPDGAADAPPTDPRLASWIRRQRQVGASPGFAERVMAAVEASGVSHGARSAWRPWTASPALRVAALLLGAVLFAVRLAALAAILVPW